MTDANKPFDPDAPASEGSGIFGLDHTPERARIVLVPVPFDATTSYRQGTADGPTAMLAASHQVDLYDTEMGAIHEAGIALLEETDEARHVNGVARALAEAARNAGDEGTRALDEVNRITTRLHEGVYARVQALLKAGKIVGTLGGEHSVAFGAIQAHVEKYPDMGVLHLDAHADLRLRFEGFEWSHASALRNVLDKTPLKTLVQVGIRDVGQSEMAYVDENGARVRTFLDQQVAERLLSGATFATMSAQIIERLPQQVYVSFDIDALDPCLCPNTGTPVPGGLSFHQACMLLKAVTDSGRQIVGFDLTEVTPGSDDFEGSFDANVGARILYKLCGRTLQHR